MQKIILTIGLPASGKSTFAREYIKQNPNFKIVCRDDLRAMVDNGHWSQKNEDLIIKIQLNTIDLILQSGYSVIVADTNLGEKVRNRIKKVASDYGALTRKPIDVIEKSFLDVSVDECIKRDLARPNSVGARVIRDMASRNGLLEKTPVTFSPDLPRAYLVDIDGTLAIMNNRGPFDWKKVGNDLPNTTVIETVRALSQTNKIFIMSGRDSVCRNETVEWLEKYQVPFDGLFMRPEGDSRGDDLIKRELYDTHIRDQYAVIGVFDDRPRVLRVWKELGLTVFDVAQSEEF